MPARSNIAIELIDRRFEICNVNTQTGLHGVELGLSDRTGRVPGDTPVDQVIIVGREPHVSMVKRVLGQVDWGHGMEGHVVLRDAPVVGIPLGLAPSPEDVAVIGIGNIEMGRSLHFKRLAKTGRGTVKILNRGRIVGVDHAM